MLGVGLRQRGTTRERRRHTTVYDERKEKQYTNHITIDSGSPITKFTQAAVRRFFKSNLIFHYMKETSVLKGNRSIKNNFEVDS